jgi:tetratricopeptide (TPR) repeat protein
VNWVSASTELFFTLFVLAGLNLYLRRHSGFFSAPFFLMALLFKETAAALPVIIFLYDYARGRAFRDRWKAYCLFIAAGVVYSLMRFHAIGGVMHHKQADLSALEAFINIFPLVGAYFAKLALPVSLSAIYEFHPARSAFDPRVMAGAAVVLAFCGALFFSRRRPAVFVGLSMMAVPLLPVLYVPALSSSAMADRYLYLPSAGLAIVLASLASRLGKKAAKASVVVVAVALLAAWAAGSVSRSQVWKSDHALWADAIEKAPNSPNAHYNYAWASHNAGDMMEAVEHYRRAASLAPSADAHYNLGVIFMGQSMIDEAQAEFRAALVIDPGFDGARARLREVQRLRGAGA